MDKLKQIFNIENRTKYFMHALVFLLLVSVGFFFLLLLGNRSLNQARKVEAAAKPSPFENVTLVAKAAFVWDVAGERELFAKNADVSLPLASLTKVMTAVTSDNVLSDAQNVRIAAEHLAPEGDSGLNIGDTWRTSDLRDFTLLTSSNDGAFALAALAGKNLATPETDPKTTFIQAMNEMAQKIGLANSRFFNEHGLDNSIDRGGAYGSARDMAALFEYALKNHPQILEATRYPALQFGSAEKVYAASNTNTIVNQIPDLLASKTGFTDLAGGNLVIAFDSGLNQPIVISVLGSTEEGRFEDTLKLVEATLQYINQKNDN